MAFGDLKVQDLIYEDGSNNEITVVLANLVVRDGSGDLVQADNKKFIAGTGSDLQIYHDGSNSWIKDTGTGSLYIDATDVFIRDSAGNENLANFRENGACNLYYNNAKKFETTSAGALLSGHLQLDGHLDMSDSQYIKLGTGDDLLIHHGGTASYIENTTGFLFLHSDSLALRSSNQENYIVAYKDGAVDLYYNGVKKFETTSSGVDIGGGGVNTVKITGTGSHELYSYGDTGGVGWCTGAGAGNYGELIYFDESNGDIILIAEGETSAKFKGNGAVELYYDDSKKFQTTSYGANIPNNGDYLAVGSSGNENSGRIGYQSNYQLYIHNNRGTATKLLLDNAGKIKSQIWDGSNLTDRFEVNTSGIKVHGPALGNNVGDEVVLANFYNTVSNGSHLEIFTKRHSTATDWTGACTRIQQKIDSTDQAYIQFNNPNYGILLGNNQHGDDKYLQCSPDSSVELYYDGTKKFETTSWGSQATGTIVIDGGHIKLGDTMKAYFGAGEDLQIFHNGTNSFIQNTEGYLLINNTSTSQPLYIQSGNRIVMQPSGGGDVLFEANKDGNVELYYDNSKKFETRAGGATVTGDLNISSELNLTGGSDAHKYLDVQVGTNAFHIRKVTGGDTGHEFMAHFRGDAECALYHNNAIKLETTSSGVNITGTLNVNGSAFSGGMPVHTANGANVANGEAFLLTSTSAIPSTWSWNGSYFSAKHRWIGWGQPRGQNTAFKFMQIFHTPHATNYDTVYWMFRNGSSWSQNSNLGDYLPIFIIRIADS